MDIRQLKPDFWQLKPDIRQLKPDIRQLKPDIRQLKPDIWLKLASRISVTTLFEIGFHRFNQYYKPKFQTSFTIQLKSWIRASANEMFEIIECRSRGLSTSDIGEGSLLQGTIRKAELQSG